MNAAIIAAQALLVTALGVAGLAALSKPIGFVIVGLIAAKVALTLGEMAYKKFFSGRGAHQAGRPTSTDTGSDPDPVAVPVAEPVADMSVAALGAVEAIDALEATEAATDAAADATAGKQTDHNSGGLEIAVMLFSGISVIINVAKAIKAYKEYNEAKNDGHISEEDKRGFIIDAVKYSVKAVAAVVLLAALATATAGVPIVMALLTSISTAVAGLLKHINKPYVPLLMRVLKWKV